MLSGVHPIALVARVGGRVQLRARVRVLPAPLAHVSRVRDAGAELVRLPQTEQVLAAAAQVHPPHTAAGAYRTTQAQGMVSFYWLVFKRLPVMLQFYYQ